MANRRYGDGYDVADLLPTHEFKDDTGPCAKCGMTLREAGFFPRMTCADVIADHEAELAFESAVS
jgi:hypothetical protein